MSSVVLTVGYNTAVWLADHDLTVEDIFVLKAFEDDEVSSILMKAYLNLKSADQKLVYLQRFVRKGLLEMLVDIEEFSWDNYRLSDEAKRILNYFISNDVIKTVELANIVSKEELTGYVDPKVIVNKEERTKFDDFIQEFREKFPEGKNGGGVSFRGSERDIKDKLHKFMNKYKFDMKTILLATDEYLGQFRMKGYQYCQAAQYFISKDQTSTLSGYCEIIKNRGEGGVGSISNPFEQRM